MKDYKRVIQPRTVLRRAAGYICREEAKRLGIPSMPINWVKVKPGGTHADTFGWVYLHPDLAYLKYIILNVDMVRDLETLRDTIRHELRHYWQKTYNPHLSKAEREKDAAEYEKRR